MTQTDFVNDTFTDTDGTVLSSHTGELGATWTQHTSYGSATITIESNRADKDGSASTGCYYASGTAPSGVNYTVEGSEIDLSNVNLSSGLCGWIDTATNTMVCVRRQNSTTVEMMKIINGTATTGLATTTVTYTQDQVRTLAITRNGTDYSAFLDGVQFGTTVSITDTELSNAGRVGVRMTGSWSIGVAYPVLYLRAYQ